MIAIFKREWKSIFSGMLGYSLCAAYVLVGGLYFWVYNLLNLYPDFGYTLYSTTFAMLVFIPILTMRSLAEERRARTDQLLLTAPVGVPSIILGKYLAMVAVFTVPVAVLGLCPLVMRMYGTVSLAKAYGALFGYWLLGCAGIAIGLFLSGLTEKHHSGGPVHLRGAAAELSDARHPDPVFGGKPAGAGRIRSAGSPGRPAGRYPKPQPDLRHAGFSGALPGAGAAVRAAKCRADQRVFGPAGGTGAVYPL